MVIHEYGSMDHSIGCYRMNMGSDHSSFISAQQEAETLHKYFIEKQQRPAR